MFEIYRQNNATLAINCNFEKVLLFIVIIVLSMLLSVIFPKTNDPWAFRHKKVGWLL